MRIMNFDAKPTYAHTVWPILPEQPNLVWYHVGRSVFLRAQPRPHPKGHGPRVHICFGTAYLHPNFWDLLNTQMVWHTTTKFCLLIKVD